MFYQLARKIGSWGISLLPIFELARSGHSFIENGCPHQKLIAPGYRATDLSQPVHNAGINFIASPPVPTVNFQDQQAL